MILNSVLPSIKSYKLSLMPRPDTFFGVPKDAENTPDPTTYAYKHSHFHCVFLTFIF